MKVMLTKAEAKARVQELVDEFLKTCSKGQRQQAIDQKEKTFEQIDNQPGDLVEMNKRVICDFCKWVFPDFKDGRTEHCGYCEVFKELNGTFPPKSYGQGREEIDIDKKEIDELVKHMQNLKGGR